MKLYHFTIEKNLTEIMRTGLIAKSDYKTFNCEMRENVIYSWLSPEHDLMGFIENCEYVLLEIEVDAKRCLVANMDFISSAYTNFVANQFEHSDVVNEMVKVYMETAIPPDKYEDGHFRSPEVLIKGNISLENINIIKKPIYENTNLITYNNLNSYFELFSDGVITIDQIEEKGLQLIAVHDDSTGILGTFKETNNCNYVTVNLHGEIMSSLTKSFFNK